MRGFVAQASLHSFAHRPPHFCPSTTVFLPSAAVACRVFPVNAEFLLINRHFPASPSISPAVLPPIARYFPIARLFSAVDYV
jgi:hypothetical protein